MWYFLIALTWGNTKFSINVLLIREKGIINSVVAMYIRCVLSTSNLRYRVYKGCVHSTSNLRYWVYKVCPLH